MSEERKRLQIPCSEEEYRSLRAGDRLLISGTLYTARDAAHKRLCALLDEGRELPFDIRGQVIYYVGPAPTPPGYAIGSAGPTTSYRMDKYAPRLLDAGLKGMIGKGLRNDEVKASMKKNGAVYFAATGGAAALIARSIISSEVIAYEDLGTEAVRKLEVRDMPVIVAVDSDGNDAYAAGREECRAALASL
jgi:fumarate hydratase subunit beta